MRFGRSIPGCDAVAERKGAACRREQQHPASGIEHDRRRRVDAGSTTIKRVHVTALRTALDAARSAIGLAAISYTDPTITAGVTVMKAAHLTELRAGTQ